MRQTLTTTCFGKVALKYFIPLGQSGNSYRVGVVFWFGGAEVPLPQSDEGNGRTIFDNGWMHSREISRRHLVGSDFQRVSEVFGGHRVFFFESHLP